MAVTRDGIPVRCWTFPGNEQDQKIIRTVMDDLSDWNPAPAGPGSPTAGLPRPRTWPTCRAAAGTTSTPEAAAALARQGRDHEVAGNLRVVGTCQGCRGAGRAFTGTTRAGQTGPAGPRAIAHLEQLIHGSYAWTPGKRDELVASLKDKPALRRLLRRIMTGLLRTNDHTLTPEDLAAAWDTGAVVTRLTWGQLAFARGHSQDSPDRVLMISGSPV